MEKEGFIRTERKCELLAIIMLVITGALFFALATDGFEVSEYAGRPIDGMLSVPNRLGQTGALIAGVLAVLFGDASHLVYAITFIWAMKLLVHRPLGRLLTRLVGVLLLVGAVSGLLHINVEYGFSNTEPGGAFGAFVAERMLFPYFAVIGSSVIAGVAAVIGMLLATDFLFVHLFIGIHRCVRLAARGLRSVLAPLWLGLRWLSGARVRAEKQIAADAYAPITDFCEQIPESAFPPRAKFQEPGLLTRVFRVFVPKHSLKRAALEIQHEPEMTDAPAVSERDDLGTAGNIEEIKPVRSEALRVHLPQDSIENSNDEESPFVEISEVIGRAREEGEYAGDLFPEDKTAPSPEQEMSERRTPEPGDDTVVAEAGEDCKVDEQDCRGSLRVDAAAAKVVSSKKNGPRLKRKPVGADDLPEDFEYPNQYVPPSLDLFALADRRIIPNLNEKLGQMATHLEETLRTFNIEAKVTDVTRGPTITRFELEPVPGTKVSRFLGLTDDIALALKAKGVRVEAPIPGKGRVGIEISNDERDPVVIRELLEHPVFGKQGGGLDLALGKDIAGNVCIADLMRMPHLLVAGATGAGKTVCIKALLSSLLFHHTPDQLQLMLIDPKMVELSIFNDIPHLITPVITDPKKASAGLQWLITEMDERYRLFADLRVRNIEVYNDSVENGEIEMEGVEGTRKTKSLSVVRKLPYIVCVIDELADLMMLARAEVEDSIMRLAQLARAVGIHMIIATQRPSVDVLTGVIKANFPARISFQVSSRVDSRCILDEIGAERLVGMGDMLYLPAGQSKPARIQGAFVSDNEMLGLIAYLKRQAPPQYRDEIANFGKSKESTTDLDHEDDPLLEDAIRIVMETQQASISMVQRRLRVGYTRAARLIDMMELKGIVGPHTGSKAREILIDPPDPSDLSEEDD